MLLFAVSSLLYAVQSSHCKPSLQALRIVIADEELREELRKINSNSRLSELFLSLARDLDVMEPKTPDEVLHRAVHSF